LQDHGVQFPLPHRTLPPKKEARPSPTPGTFADAGSCGELVVRATVGVANESILVLIERKYRSNHVDSQVGLDIDQDEIVVDYPVSELLGQNW
jgi:hypothetical protein